MRSFSQNATILLSTGNISIYYLVEMIISGQTLRHVNLPYDITINGLGTFYSDGNLLAIEAPKLSTVVDREAYKITYADPDFSFKSLFENGAVGSSVKVYIGFINTLNSTFGDADPGAPMKNREDIILAYKGILDSHGYTITEDDEVVVALEASSPMADLDLKKSFFTSKDSLKVIAPNDTSFDQVYEGSREISLLWGKV